MIPPFEHEPNSSFLGFPTSQNRYAIPAWSYSFERLPPEVIVEIGANCCGMTCLLGIAAKNCGARMLTCDVTAKDEERTPWLDWLNVEYIQGDCFGQEFHDRAKSMLELNRRDRAAYVLCDGGDKVREFRTFAPLLKSGDVIAAHDCWAGEAWPWQEITEGQVEPACRVYDLENWMPWVFASTGWLVRRKR